MTDGPAVFTEAESSGRRDGMRLPARWLPAIAIAAVAAVAHGGDTAPSDWPHWRGPTGNGVSADATPPVDFEEFLNVTIDT